MQVHYKIGATGAVGNMTATITETINDIKPVTSMHMSVLPAAQIVRLALISLTTIQNSQIVHHKKYMTIITHSLSLIHQQNPISNQNMPHLTQNPTKK